MSSALATEPVPLSTDSDQVIRVAGTRVTLETLVDVFDSGATPDEIARDFPALRLDDIYAVIAYYLRHRKEVATYMRKRRVSGAKIRERVARRQDHSDLKRRLQARLGR